MKKIVTLLVVLMCAPVSAHIKEGVSGTYAIAQECAFTDQQKTVMGEKIMRTAKITQDQLDASAQWNWSVSLSSVRAQKQSMSEAEWNDFCGSAKSMLLMDERK